MHFNRTYALQPYVWASNSFSSRIDLPTILVNKPTQGTRTKIEHKQYNSLLLVIKIIFSTPSASICYVLGCPSGKYPRTILPTFQNYASVSIHDQRNELLT